MKNTIIIDWAKITSEPTLKNGGATVKAQRTSWVRKADGTSGNQSFNIEIELNENEAKRWPFKFNDNVSLMGEASIKSITEDGKETMILCVSNPIIEKTTDTRGGLAQLICRHAKFKFLDIQAEKTSGIASLVFNDANGNECSIKNVGYGSDIGKSLKGLRISNTSDVGIVISLFANNTDKGSYINGMIAAVTYAASGPKQTKTNKPANAAQPAAAPAKPAQTAPAAPARPAPTAPKAPTAPVSQAPSTPAKAAPKAPTAPAVKPSAAQTPAPSAPADNVPTVNVDDDFLSGFKSFSPFFNDDDSSSGNPFFGN